MWRVKTLREDPVHTHRYPAALSGRQAFPRRALRRDARFLSLRCLPCWAPPPGLYLGWRNLAHSLGSDYFLPGCVFA